MGLADDLKHKAEQWSDTAKEKYHQAQDKVKEEQDRASQDIDHKGGEIDRNLHQYSNDLEGNNPDYDPANRPGVDNSDRDDLAEKDNNF